MLLLAKAPKPSQIFSNLWIGTLWNAKELLETNPGVSMVVNCTSETLPRIATAHMIQLGLDGGIAIPAAKLDYLVRVIHEYTRQHASRAVLICDHDGLSLAPGLMLAYLVSCGIGMREAFLLIEARHPITGISDPVIDSIKRHFGY